MSDSCQSEYLVHSDRRGRWVTVRLQAEHIALHCSTAHHDSDTETDRRTDGKQRRGRNEERWAMDMSGTEQDRETYKGNATKSEQKLQKKKKKMLVIREWECCGVPAHLRIRLTTLSVSCLSANGTVQIPVTANNTCIHHCWVDLQSLVIYTPVLLSAWLPNCLDPLSVTISIRSNLLAYIKKVG